MKNFIYLGLALFVSACAGGKMGKIDQALESGAVTKGTPIYIETVNAQDAYFSGDKSANEVRVKGEKREIEEMYNQLIAAELTERGYDAKSVKKAPNKGIVVTGKVTKFEHGSAAARAFVGMGAGSSNLFATFEIQDKASAKTLGKFEIIATSGGQGGLGAMGSYIEAHLKDGAEKFAEYVEKGK